MSSLDHKYLQLYHMYLNAIKGFENAKKDRKRVRAMIEAKNKLVQPVRRPIGSSPDYLIPKSQGSVTRHTGKKQNPRIYLGPILGWAKIIYTPNIVQEHDPIGDFDMEKHYDQLSLGVYWNAKIHYLTTKRAFFNYVRAQNIDLHRTDAQNAITHEQNKQLLGLSEDADLDDAQNSMEAACKNALGLFLTSSNPKSTKVIMILLDNLAEANFVGLESETTKRMWAEIEKLKVQGRIKFENTI